MILKEISGKVFKVLVFKNDLLMISKEISRLQVEIQGSGVGVQGSGVGVQGSGVGGASLWKAAAQAATRSGLGGDLYFLFLSWWQF